MPIAAEGKIKVSIDYRMPEHIFHPPPTILWPYCAYRAVRPENIGIYGGSAGAVPSPAVARFQQEDLPQPAAIAMSCASGHGWHDGDPVTLQQVCKRATPRRASVSITSISKPPTSTTRWYSRQTPGGAGQISAGLVMTVLILP